MGNVEVKRIDSVFSPDFCFLKNAKITREYFDYFLHDLSSEESKEKFIELCKRLITEEFCGDIQLYDEDDSKSKFGPLYVGEDMNGSKVAFRINIKSNWMKHYENDMKMYSSEDSSVFNEFFFITNQDIIPKVLFNYETKFLTTKKVKVHLYDRKWIIDKIFEHESYMEIALEVFGLSHNLNYDEEINSYKNQSDAIEEDLKEIDAALDGCIEGEDGEKKVATINFEDMKKRFDSAIMIIDQMYNQFENEDELNEKRYNYLCKYRKILELKGDIEELKTFLFECAIQYFFSDNDISRFVDFFDSLCKLLEEQSTADLYEINVILWAMLRKSEASPDERGSFLNRINESYERLLEEKISEEDENKIAHANTFLCMYTKDEKAKRMEAYSKIVLRLFGQKSIRLYYFAMLYMEDRYYFSNNQDLIEVCIDNLIRVLKEHDVPATQVGRILLKQAMDGTKKNYSDDMYYYTEALKCFESDEQGEYLIAKTLYEMGKIYEGKKLYWLSRNIYCYGFTKCLGLYEKKGYTSKLFLKLASKLKTVELSLGRIMYSTRYYCLESIIREINNDNVGKSQDTYDFTLAVLIYRTPLMKLEQIGKLSRYFEKYGLYYSNIAVKHELGHYDKKLLNALENNKKTFDEYVEKWKQQPVAAELKDVEPWYGVEYKAHFSLDFMGCEVKLDIENKAITLEYTTMLFAALQSILYSASPTEVQAEKVKIYILHDKESMFNVNVTHYKEYDNKFVIKIGNFDKTNIEAGQQILKGHIADFVNTLMNVIFRHKTTFNKIKNVIENPDVVGRHDVVASSFMDALSSFGFNTFNYNLLTSGYDNILSNRSIDEVFPNQNLSEKIRELKRRLRATFEKNELIKEKIMNNVIIVSTWDAAGWETVDIPNKAGNLPIIAFVFKSEHDGKAIFNNWIEKYGNDDKNNYIGIRILKKIDASEPFKYRVIVGNTRKLYNEEDGSEIETPVYTCTVSAENVAKLYTFERLMKTNTHYLICPAFYDEDGDILYDWSRMIKKRASSIKCANAWEIDMDDMLFTEGVFSTDKPVIMNGEDCVALISLIEEKKVRVEVLNAAMNMMED